MEQSYKEKYEDILARLAKAKNDNDVCNERFCCVINDLIPELAESEDEKIRKGIFKALSKKDARDVLISQGVEVSDALAWLEKQAEKKPILDFKAKDWYVSKVDGKIHNIYHSVDKVEPKFKVGDWIVQGCNILKIRCVGDEYYCFETVGGYVDDMLVSEIDSLYHLWTIQDAKDGDVLYLQHDGKEHIIIYKGVIKERFRTFVSAYCAYNGIVDAFCFADVSRYADLAYGGIVPATKEQRDTLLKAMADAGYTFDFEKKNLKKIVQKPEENKGNIGGISPNSAWSEEDEKMLDSICISINEESIAEALRGRGVSHSIEDLTTILSKQINWLKSIKDRVQPQPKQEWSEEDKKKIDRIYLLIREAADEHAFGTTCRLIGDKECIELQDWLKSIIHQNSYESK